MPDGYDIIHILIYLRERGLRELEDKILKAIESLSLKFDALSAKVDSQGSQLNNQGNQLKRKYSNIEGARTFGPGQ